MPNQERGIEWYLTPGGAKRYRVRWRDGHRQRSRSFRRLIDARRFYAESRLASERGQRLALAGAEDLSMAQFVAETWAPKQERKLASGTWKKYKGAYNKYILKSLGPRFINQIDAEDLVEWQDDMERSGVGKPTQIRAIGILSSIFKEAARRPRATGVQINPVALLEKPSAKRRKQPKVFGPEAIEAVRYQLITKSRRIGKDKKEIAIRDGALLSFLYLTGARPGEILGLKVASIQHDIHITAAVSDSVLVDLTKTKTDRTVPIKPALQKDIDALIKLFNLKDGDLLFSKSDGTNWNESDWRNWRQRHFDVACERTGIYGLDKITPYELGRHSHSALMLASGMTLPRLAAIQGHSIRVLSEHYSAVIAEYEDKAFIDPDLEVADARQKVFGKLNPSTGR